MFEVLKHDLQSGEFLGAPFHRVDMDRSLALANRAMRGHERLQHCDVNVAKIIQMRSDPNLARHVRESDIVCIDGAGVMLGCRLLGIATGGRVTGVDLMMRTIDLCERGGFRPYFLGARQEVVETVVARLRETHPNLKVAGYRNGYFKREDEAGIVADIRASGADCLFVGITSPIKERFLFEHRDALNVPFQMGVGGAFDVLAGTRVPCRFFDRECDIRIHKPVITLDHAGAIQEIRFNAHLVDLIDLPLETVDAWYRAYRAFMRLTRDPAFRLSFRMAAGEMTAFDNRRILHGREAFNPATGNRHLHGCYVDRVEFDSRMRMLAARH